MGEADEQAEEDLEADGGDCSLLLSFGVVVETSDSSSRGGVWLVLC